MTTVFFAASRYWTDGTALRDACRAIMEKLDNGLSWELVVDGKGADKLAGKCGDALVAIPMSGAVQRDILAAAASFRRIALYSAYVRGNADDSVCDSLLTRNAAPTVMECWSVLRGQGAFLAVTRGRMRSYLRALGARESVKGAKILLIGEAEPWVISPSRAMEDYEMLGVRVEVAPQSEVAERYAAAAAEDGAPYAEHFLSRAGRIAEPSGKDIANAGRMAWALVTTLAAHGADGMAIACFDLLKTGTNACVAVSYINDCTDKFAACEGDLDSALTMLCLRKLTKTKCWMANPGLHPDGLVNFSHCTAPVNILGDGDMPLVLRSHHESGIGVSPQIELPVGWPLTACRISARAKQMTVQRAVSVDGPYEPCCRTQMYVRFDDFDKYLNTALGCHQVFCFEDVAEEAALLGEMLGLDVL